MLMQQVVCGAFFVGGAVAEIATRRRQKQKKLAKQQAVESQLQRSLNSPIQTECQQSTKLQQQNQLSFSLKQSTSNLLIFLRIVQLLIFYFLRQNSNFDKDGITIWFWGTLIILCLLEVLCWKIYYAEKSLFKSMQLKKIMEETNEKQTEEESDDSNDRQLLREKFSGIWIKDRERSDSMEKAMDIMGMRGIVRAAVGLIRGVEVKYSKDEFVFSVFSYIMWFKITERYPLNGDICRYNRRDLRSGQHTGYVEEKGQKVMCRVVWSDPFGGSNTDVWSCPNDDELHVESSLNVAGQSVSFTTVYKKQH
eukprot:TRINITY_DN961_c0_g2_i1.p2 TRINITY_DN961_c0_g2~~TRINITY_DN961_c0_g2_i1.p2  ORF type:complete len:308 (-),score=38.65 TRINITY_DN961_c0_g2_i1:219-1142(-)